MKLLFWVPNGSKSVGIPALARGARDLIAKISDVVPEHLRPMVLETAMSAPTVRVLERDALDMARVRTFIRTRGKLRVRYRSDSGLQTTRVIWPIALAYFETVRLIVAWCELRQAFRHFRTDRIEAAEFLDETYPGRIRDLRAAWQKQEQDNLIEKKTTNGPVE